MTWGPLFVIPLTLIPTPGYDRYHDPGSPDSWDPGSHRVRRPSHQMEVNMNIGEEVKEIEFAPVEGEPVHEVAPEPEREVEPVPAPEPVKEPVSV